MDAEKTKIIQFLEGNKQFTIPLYQRKYSWTIEQCKKLLEDLIRTGKNDNIESHFLGSIVSMQEQSPLINLTRLMIIDGQQRLTTVSLLLIALIEYLRTNDENSINPEKLLNSYLVNQYEEKEDKYKLLLTQDDKIGYINVVNNLYSQNPQKIIETSIRINENYKYFKRNIKENNYQDIYNGLIKLIIIHVGLEYHKDNPQLIFESLNSTGLELNNADLIRNYILMSLEKEEQERLYEDYWHRMEVMFEKSRQKNLFDRFIRDYLTIKLERIPKNKAVYQEFKDFSLKYDSIDELVKDVYKYAQYYFNIVLKKEKNKELKIAFSKFNKLEFDITRPFLLKIYEDYDNEKISSEDFIEIIRIIESYLVRRAICDIPTPSLNKTFADLYYEIDSENYIESLKIALIIKRTSKRFPNDLEFKENFLVKDIYNSRINEYILKTMEEYPNPKEKTDFNYLSIEHIMPQNPDAEDWINDLGEEKFHVLQKQYLHTIGNLTLTGYNSEYSDNGFEKKKTMKYGFDNSTLNLNQDLKNINKWDEEEINKRGAKLYKLARKIWTYPQVKNEKIEIYKKKHGLDGKGSTKKTTKTKDLYLEYWTQISKYIKEQSVKLNPGKEGKHNFYDISINCKGAYIALLLNSMKKRIIVEIKIPKNKDLFDHLYNQKEDIENSLGYELDWIKSDDMQATQIKSYNYINPLEKDKWEETIKWHVETAEKFEEIFKGRIDEYYENE